MKKAVVIGAGVSGLAAADRLLAEGWEVTVIEARARVGGRLHALEYAPGVPIDLGPEFLHGGAEEVKRLLDSSEVISPSESAKIFWKGNLSEAGNSLNFLDDAMKKLRCLKGEDAPVAELFSRLKLDDFQEAELRSYIEGFNAIDMNHASQCAFQREIAGGADDMEVARLKRGYGSLLPVLSKRWEKNFSLCLEAWVNKIEWEAGSARVHFRAGEEARHVEAPFVLITLPPTILADKNKINLDPELPEHRLAAQALPLGAVHKVVFVLDEPLWDTGDKDLAFLHSPGLIFGTRWIWMVHDKPIFVCWSGGSRAMQLNGLPREEVIRLALADAATSLKITPAELSPKIKQSYYHDWMLDPFSLGAYSYVRLGGLGSRAALAKPVAGTLFFAGEATADDGSAGTVHGALRSGHRAAEEMMEAEARR
ncbi:MAG: FAD-dependent oxidoreductase [Proteobacteria bacterium]|nr:MAG: FAD-dependent oxidoreductase [Pseudomonadota bacterium]